jgi:hypothetical protein
LYDQSPDEFRTSIDPQPEANPQLPIQSWTRTTTDVYV